MSGPICKLTRKEFLGVVNYLEANAEKLAKDKPTVTELVAAVHKNMNGKLRSHIILNNQHITSIIDDAEITLLKNLRRSNQSSSSCDGQSEINENVLRCLNSILGWMNDMEDNLGEGSSKLSEAESFLSEAENLVYGSKEVS